METVGPTRFVIGLCLHTHGHTYLHTDMHTCVCLYVCTLNSLVIEKSLRSICCSIQCALCNLDSDVYASLLWLTQTHIPMHTYLHMQPQCNAVLSSVSHFPVVLSCTGLHTYLPTHLWGFLPGDCMPLASFYRGSQPAGSVRFQRPVK